MAEVRTQIRVRQRLTSDSLRNLTKHEPTFNLQHEHESGLAESNESFSPNRHNPSNPILPEKSARV